MTDLKKFLTVDSVPTSNLTSVECGLFGVRCPVLSWAASAACCVERTCCVLRSKADVVYDVLRMPGHMCEVFNLSSGNGV